MAGHLIMEDGQIEESEVAPGHGRLQLQPGGDTPSRPECSKHWYMYLRTVSPNMGGHEYDMFYCVHCLGRACVKKREGTPNS